eukprot:2138487-Ditylum_brightwellii.AAC.1
MKWALNYKQRVVATGRDIWKSASEVGENLACYRIFEIYCTCKDHFVEVYSHQFFLRDGASQ